MIDTSIVRYQRLCVFSGLAFMIVFFIALLGVAGFIPPPGAPLCP